MCVQQSILQHTITCVVEIFYIPIPCTYGCCLFCLNRSNFLSQIVVLISLWCVYCLPLCRITVYYLNVYQIPHPSDMCLCVVSVC